jgi:flagellar basal-body rod protein FlgF
MSHDIYPSLSGASAAWKHLEVISNNIANASTTGFKEQRLSFESALVAEGPLGEGYFSDGSVVNDNVETHLALRGRGFFQLEDGSLSRAGAFALDRDGFLVTSEGEKVMGESGAIQLAPGERLSVGIHGEIMADGAEIDRLALVDAEQLEPLGGTRWRANSKTFPANVEVIQGALESSNADPMRSMTELIQTTRYFEIYRSAMQASDELDRTNISIAREA